LRFHILFIYFIFRVELLNIFRHHFCRNSSLRTIHTNTEYLLNSFLKFLICKTTFDRFIIYPTCPVMIFNCLWGIMSIIINSKRSAWLVYAITRCIKTTVSIYTSYRNVIFQMTNKIYTAIEKELISSSYRILGKFPLSRKLAPYTFVFLKYCNLLRFDSSRHRHSQSLPLCRIKQKKLLTSHLRINNANRWEIGYYITSWCIYTISIQCKCLGLTSWDRLIFPTTSSWVANDFTFNAILNRLLSWLTFLYFCYLGSFSLINRNIK
jgi:hypothetical protein